MKFDKLCEHRFTWVLIINRSAAHELSPIQQSLEAALLDIQVSVDNEERLKVEQQSRLLVCQAGGLLRIARRNPRSDAWPFLNRVVC
jgi:hypothetical protein